MTSEEAYQMGFRHISDLAEMNRIADLVSDYRFADYALELMEAWRQGAVAAKALLEKEVVTLQ